MEVDGVIASTRTGIDADTASEKTDRGGKEPFDQNKFRIALELNLLKGTIVIQLPNFT